jgi:hypothetical protein
VHFFDAASVAHLSGYPLPQKLGDLGSWVAALGTEAQQSEDKTASNDSGAEEDISSESLGGSELSQVSEDEANLFDVHVERIKAWTTQEDQELERIEALAAWLRPHPLLPPEPRDANQSWKNVSSGIKLPVCHCAFAGCAWTSMSPPCEFRSGSQRLRAVRHGLWQELPPRTPKGDWGLGCCDQATCLRQHLMDEHVEALIKCCGRDQVAADSFDYYCEAIAVQERKKMPTLGVSIDRRTFCHIRENYSEEAVQALVCMCCAQIHRCSDSVNGEIGHISAFSYFEGITGAAFDQNWDFEEYMRLYGSTPSLSNHPALEASSREWKVKCDFGKWNGRFLMCCPEDITCEAKTHGPGDLCAKCQIPLCRDCLLKSSLRDQKANGVPMALANDNFWGFPPDIIYRWKVRWLEAAAASPVFTCLITYYVEGDRGHLLQEEHLQQKGAVAVRGNAFSYGMPWEDITDALSKMCDDKALVDLPHTDTVLSKMVQFNLRVGDIVDLNKWLPEARLRPHVVLKLLFFLIDAKHPAFGDSLSAQRLKRRVQKLVAERYPEQEGHLAEEERQGNVPPAVAAAIERAARPVPGSREAGARHKNATPAPAPEDCAAALDGVRPVSLFPDRDARWLEDPNTKSNLALGEHSKLCVTTGNTFIQQWHAKYPSLAFPFSFPRAVSGADYPNKHKWRRHARAPFVDSGSFTRALPKRIEAGVRNDWTLVPAQRNLDAKWRALCGEDAAVKHEVDQKQPGNVHAAELTTAAAGLYKQLRVGHWFDGKKRRKINHDVSKLRYATNLSSTEKNLVQARWACQFVSVLLVCCVCPQHFCYGIVVALR